LPAKAMAREHRLSELVSEPRTLIFYEAKHRILSFLKSMLTVFGELRQIVVARELTKKFETVYQGPLLQVLADIADCDQAQKGEFVVLLEGSREVHADVDLDKVLKPLLAELSVSSASKLAAKISGLNKNQCYQRALILQQGK
jgi:16S rRNA (cytidine1402-2'-O)-methyltransferase